MLENAIGTSHVSKLREVTAGGLQRTKREDLVRTYHHVRDVHNEWIKRMITQDGRLEILCEQVLGYEVAPHHQAMIDHQGAFLDSLVLAFRGAGKSTIGTISRAIYHVLRNPNIRILIASKTSTNASDFLREIKRHFESNELLIEIFGNYVGLDRWDNTAIEVRRRTIPAKEPTINTVGYESAVASKHYDIIFVDDLIEEETSRTPQQRERVHNWFYNTLLPCLEPPEPGVDDRGLLYKEGTRYHPEDLYGHWQKYDNKKSTLKLASLVDEQGRPHIDGESVWPDKFTTEHLKEMKRNMGTIRFMLQMMCDVSTYTDSPFEYEHFIFVEEDEIPVGLRILITADLAIAQTKKADKFSLMVCGIDRMNNLYLLDGFRGQLPFHEQEKLLLAKTAAWNPVRVLVESNAYQLALVQELIRKSNNKTLFKPIYTSKDKKTRSLYLSAYIEAGRLRVLRSMEWVVEQLLLFPGEGRDVFDALDFAVAHITKVRSRRLREPRLYTIGRK